MNGRDIVQFVRREEVLARLIMKMMITGSGGFIGRFLRGYFIEKEFELLGIDIRDAPSVDLLGDISDQAEFAAAIDEYAPDVVIHCGAIKDIDFCEANKIDVWQTNVGSSNAIVQYLSDRPSAKGVYISSDIVFDGRLGLYTESNIPNPINWYGITKFHSELLFSRIENHSICRTSLVIGSLGPEEKSQLVAEIENEYLRNQTLLPFYIYQHLKKGNELKLSDNNISSPTHVLLIAQAIERIIQGDKRGIFHLSGSEPVSRLQFGRKIARFHGLADNSLSAGEGVCSVLRPKDVGLDIKHTYRELGFEVNDWTVDNMFGLIDWGDWQR